MKSRSREAKISIPFISGAFSYYFAHFISAIAFPTCLLQRLLPKLVDVPYLYWDEIVLQNSFANKPEVRFFEGVEGIKKIYELTLTVGLTIYYFVNAENINPELKKWIEDYYLGEKLRRKIWIYNIMTADEETTALMSEKQGFRENKLISKEQYPFHMEVMTFGDYVTFLHFRKSDAPSAILIKSQAAAETMLSIHKLIWNNIKSRGATRGNP